MAHLKNNQISCRTFPEEVYLTSTRLGLSNLISSLEFLSHPSAWASLLK